MSEPTSGRGGGLQRLVAALFWGWVACAAVALGLLLAAPGERRTVEGALALADLVILPLGLAVLLALALVPLTLAGWRRLAAGWRLRGLAPLVLLVLGVLLLQVLVVFTAG